MGSIVVISGPVGAGKTTVARALVASLEAPTAFIEGDVFWSFIVRPAPGRGRGRNVQTIMRAMFRSAAAFADDGYAALLDFSMPLAFVAAASARAAGSVIDYVELRPTLETCAARAAARPEGVIADYGPYADFYTVFDAPERHVIRNDAAEPSAVAAEIRSGLEAAQFRL